jgi:hypothetical protein
MSSELEKERVSGMREGMTRLEGVWRGRNGDVCQPKRGLTLPHMYPSIGSARWADQEEASAMQKVPFHAQVPPIKNNMD